jgi:hypothetical protein
VSPDASIAATCGHFKTDMGLGDTDQGVHEGSRGPAARGRVTQARESVPLPLVESVAAECVKTHQSDCQSRPILSEWLVATQPASTAACAIRVRGLVRLRSGP